MEEVPQADKAWLSTTKTQWVTFWTSEIARLVDAETQRPAVLRLFTLYDERERAYREYRRKRVVKGSTGQPVINPVWKQVPVMDMEIRQLEDRFGLTPQSQLKLGVTFGHAARTLDEMNKRLNEDENGASDEGAAEDPRTLRLEA